MRGISSRPRQRLPTYQPRTKKMKGFGDGALSNSHFPKVPSGGRPAGARSRRMPPQAWLGRGERQPHASIVILLSSFAMRWTVPVPSDLATFKIPFASRFSGSRGLWSGGRAGNFSIGDWLFNKGI